MTISYSGSFLRILIRWKGSIWRSTWKELVGFLVLYYAIRAFYIFIIPLLDGHEQEGAYRQKFEALCAMFDNYTKMIPLTFLLGFYVSNVVSRWQQQFVSLSWPEDILSLLCIVCPGVDERSKKRRHLVARYLNATFVLVMRDISSRMRMRFPNVRSLVTIGLLTEKELEALESINEESPGTRWMVPLHWCQHVVAAEAKDNSPQASLVNSFLQELKGVRASYRKLFLFDWVCVPLPYTQDYQIDLYLPLFTIVQFLFFVGWFKVAQDLMRPFGMDDDDIEINYIFERNLATSFAIVHKLQEAQPPSEDCDDFFWNARQSGKLPPLPETGFTKHQISHRPKLHSYIEVNGEDSEQTDITADLGCTTRVKHKRYLQW